MSGWRVVDEFFLNGVRYYTQEQLDAAVRQAEQRVMESILHVSWYEDVFAAGVAAARDAVAAAHPAPATDDPRLLIRREATIAAIDALTLDRQAATPTKQAEPLERP